jgi:hypothetical protein
MVSGANAEACSERWLGLYVYVYGLRYCAAGAGNVPGSYTYDVVG